MFLVHNWEKHEVFLPDIIKECLTVSFNQFRGDVSTIVLQHMKPLHKNIQATYIQKNSKDSYLKETV